MSGSSSAASEFLSDLPTEQLTEAQLGFVLAVRGLPVGSGDDLVEGEDLRLLVVDLFPPGVLLSPEMMRVPLLHQGLLALLRTNGVTLGGSSDMRSVKRLAATLYPSGADKDFAVSALNRFEERQVQLCLHGDAAVMPGWPSGLDRQPNHAESGRETPQSIQGGASSRPAQFASQPGVQQDVRYSGGNEAIDSQHPSNLPPLSSFGNPALRTGGSAVHTEPAITTAGGALDSNLAHRVSLRFKDNQAKFSGDARECLDDFVADYNLAGRDFGLSPEQKLRYLHNLLRGDAKRFYLSELEPFATSYVDAVARIRAEYHSAVHQSQAQNTLSSLRMASFVANGMTEQDALAETYRTIARTAKLLPPSHQGEAHRVNYLRGAVVGYPWATEPLSRIPTARLGFQQLYGELQSTLFLCEEAKRAVLQDSAINAKPVAASSGAMDVLYGGQRWYATNPKDKGGYGSGKPSGRFNPLSVMGCFNCDKPNHSAKDCPEPYNGAKQDARRQEYQAKRSAKRAAVVQVMYELCGQAVALRDGPAGSEMTGEGEGQPAGEQETLFQALMEGAGLTEDASKRGAEMDEQGFQPRE